MIARVWSARVTREQARRYADYLRTHVFEELRTLDGYDRALLLERPSPAPGPGIGADVVEVQVITFWHSLDAIRAFSGPDLEAAVVTDLAAGMLLDYDRRVRHYEIVLRDERRT